MLNAVWSRRRLRFTLPAIALAIVGSIAVYLAASWKNSVVYTMCREVAGFSGETIELNDGRFSYWFYSDVVTDDEPTYPLKGTYEITGSTLKLNHPELRNSERTIAVINGVEVLWRKDGLEGWEKEERIHPYAVLLRVAGGWGEPRPDQRPSIELLKSAKLKDRDRKEYEERHNDQPAEARTLLRACSQKGVPHMGTYKAEIARARAGPDPKLVAQLVALLGQESPSRINASMILKDLYGSSFLLKDPPPFLKNEDSRKRGLECLIDGLSSAPDRDALEETLMVFLRASGVRKIDLAIPETPLRIRLEAFAPDGGSYDSQGTPVDDISWFRFMSKAVPACQKWMRARLEK